MISKIYNGKVSFLELATIFLLVKIITYSLDIVPVGEELTLRFQLLNQILLEKDLLGSLYFFTLSTPNLEFNIWHNVKNIWNK